MRDWLINVTYDFPIVHFVVVAKPSERFKVFGLEVVGFPAKRLFENVSVLLIIQKVQKFSLFPGTSKEIWLFSSSSSLLVPPVLSQGSFLHLTYPFKIFVRLFQLRIKLLHKMLQLINSFVIHFYYILKNFLGMLKMSISRTSRI